MPDTPDVAEYFTGGEGTFVSRTVDGAHLLEQMKAANDDGWQLRGFAPSQFTPEHDCALVDTYWVLRWKPAQTG